MTFIQKTHKHLIAALLLMLLATGMSAQNKPKEKVEAMRVAFITCRLDLTPDEAKLFWPIYENYRHDLSKLRRSFYPSDDGSDPHLDADRQLEFEQKKLDLKKTYKPQFEQVLGKEKLNKLIGAEEDFKRMLIQTIRNRRQQRPVRR
jgi:hypothetical protein